MTSPNSGHDAAGSGGEAPASRSRRMSVDDLAHLARGLLRPFGRTILGVVGKPGSGKTSLAEHLGSAIGDAVVIPMDGFHLSNDVLRSADLSERKGAPETFDVDGYCALLQRLRSADTTVYAPTFDRRLNESIGSAVVVPLSTRLIITEGNYLLLRREGWSAVRSMLDACWYLDVDDEVRIERLVQRHVSFGRSREGAMAWVASVDQPNANLVAESAAFADAVIRLA
jgi:pantothenate kinase